LSKANGVVEKIWENQLPNGKTTYTIVIDGERYGTYTTKPSCKMGDNIELDYEDKGNFKNANVKSIKLVAKAVDAPETKPALVPARTYVKDESTQNSIVYQNARGHAVQMVDTLLKNGVIDLGSKAKGKPAVDVVLTWLDGFTKRFYEDTKALGHEAPTPAEATPVVAKVKTKPAPPVEELEFEDDNLPF